jgi:hypothetical protein
VVCQFILCIPRICPGKDTAGSDDAKEQEGIVDVVEGVHADAVSSLKTGMLKPSDEFTNSSSSLA